MARPRKFEEAAALDAAVTCFWALGYANASVRDLAAEMGVSGPSLYNAFGDKRTLFTRSLERYCETSTYPLIARIEATNAPGRMIAAFFAEIVERSVCDRGRRGCFLINSALEVAPHDAELRRAIGKHLGEIQSFFQRGLSAARNSSGARTPGDIEVAADHLLAVLLGIRVLARSRPERSLLQGIVRAAIEPLGLAGGARRQSAKRGSRH